RSWVAGADAANLICAGNAMRAGSVSRAAPAFAGVWSVRSIGDAVFGARGRGLATPVKTDRFAAFAAGAMPNGSAGFNVGFCSGVPMAPAIVDGAPEAARRSCDAAATDAFDSAVPPACCDEVAPIVAQSRPAAGALVPERVFAGDVTEIATRDVTGALDVPVDGGIADAATIVW